MNYRHLWAQIRDLTRASIKARYRKTWAGFIWVVFNPIMIFGVQGLVFKRFLQIEVPNYHLFLLGGLLPWIFFSSTVLMGTPVFVNQSNLLRSFKINPMVILASQILDNFINFLASFTLILLPLYIFSNRPVLHLLLMPLALLPLLTSCMALTITFSILNVFYRDINFVSSFIFSLLFFLTPIIYPQYFVPVEWQWLIQLNPILYFIRPFRSLLYDSSLTDFFYGLAQSGLFAIGFVLIAYVVWKRKVNDFYRKL